MSMANAARVAGKLLWPFVARLLTEATAGAVKNPKTWENARGLTLAVPNERPRLRPRPPGLPWTPVRRWAATLDDEAHHVRAPDHPA